MTEDTNGADGEGQDTEQQEISDAEMARREQESERMKGNSLAEGHGAPENNQNAASHQLNADPAKVLKWMEAEVPEAHQWVEDKFESYLEHAPFERNTAQADKLRETCVCEFIIWKNRGVQVMGGVTKQTHERQPNGEMVEVEAERPNNQAVNRMDRQVMSKLDKLDCLPSPEARKADAMEEMSNEHYEIIDVESEPVDG